MSSEKKRQSFKKILFKISFVVGLLVLEQASLISSLYIVYRAHFIGSSMVHYLYSLPFMIVSSIFLFDYFKLSNFQRKPVSNILLDSLKYVITFISVTCIYAYFLNLFALSRYALLLGSLFFYVLLSLWTIFNQKIALRLYSRVSLLILSENEEDANKIMAKIRCEEKKLHLDIIGWLKPADALNDDELFRKATEVLISSNVEEKVKFEILYLCSKLNKLVYIIPSFYDLSFSRYKIVKFYDTPSFQTENSGLTVQQKLLKRAFDMLFSSLILILTSPLFLLIALAVKLDSRGPVFYMQDRVTYNGKVYKVYKFRTMVSNAEELYGAYQSTGDDPRVTRFGKFLRNSHLDELPQFINVILGSLSVVGPRSDRTNTIDIMGKQAVGYDYRLKVKSGITGMAQLFGKYNSDPEDKLRYDIYYIKNYSLLFDLQLIFLTAISMLKWTKNDNIVKGGSDYYIAGKE